jgi:hypothetical protein
MYQLGGDAVVQGGFSRTCNPARGGTGTSANPASAGGAQNNIEIPPIGRTGFRLRRNDTEGLLHEAPGIGGDVVDPPSSHPSIKSHVCQLLGCSDHDTEGEWGQLPARKAVNALFSFLYSTDHRLKWCAVGAMGKMVARLADEDLEAARNVVRRLMWSLNDESGGIGWGSAEALGEILARHAGLAREYAHILLSYAREDGNLLENDGLLRGVLWGLTRVAGTRPDLYRDAARHITIHLQSRDGDVRALAVELLGVLGDATVRDRLQGLADDQTEVTLFSQGCEQRVRIADLAARALARLG